ncbi:type III secretion protein [Pseudomonas sp. CCM 7891]|uniref:Type III secretion protein n=1 Tax=Pseudomonas karstica TaxID=1055468 RepID=A0A7X2RRY0_9PSED|nr:type III secretion protein [Pseudomonas karstica]MTD19943.1 type III secretion protein [Pseudomonas karstica]
MKDLLIHWLGTREEQITLLEDNDEIILRRHAGVLLLNVQLTHDRLDKSLLQTWMRLGGASLNHFQGALTQAPASGALWLTQCLPGRPGETQLLGCLESLLNQRDTWRAIVARLARPVQKLHPTSLRSLLH